MYHEEGLFDQAAKIAPYWEEALHSLKNLDNVIDIRNLGFVGGIEMSTQDGKIGKRGYNVFEKAFHDKNVLLRFTGDIIALSPPLIAKEDHVDQIIDSLREIIPFY